MEVGRAGAVRLPCLMVATSAVSDSGEEDEEPESKAEEEGEAAGIEGDLLGAVCEPLETGTSCTVSVEVEGFPRPV